MSEVNVKFGAQDESLSSTLNKVERELKQVENQAKETNSKFSASFKGMAVAAAGVAVGIAAFRVAFNTASNAVNYLRESVEKASDMGETISKVGQIFGDGSKEIEKWASTAATAMGQSKQQAMDAASQFAIFGKAAGLSGSNLTGFAKELTGLATDLSSFNNTTPEEAILAIGSALRGEAEPMRRFGVLLDDASLRTEALKMGLIQTTKDALTPQQKVLAAHALIMSQTSLAQGDFARTSGGLANQSKILTANFADLKTRIGNSLLPTFTLVTKAMNDHLVPAFEYVARVIEKLDISGYAERIAKAFTGGMDAINGFKFALAAIKAGELSLSFEIAFASIKLQIKQTANEIYRNMSAAFSAVATTLMDVLGPYSAIRGTLENTFVYLGKVLSKSVIDSLAAIAGKVPAIGALIGGSLKDVAKDLDGEVERASKRITAYSGMIKDDLIEAGKAFPQSFKDAYNSTKPLMDLSKDLESVAKLQEEIKSKEVHVFNDEDDMVKNVWDATTGVVANLDKIKQLEEDIKTAKATGNEELAKTLSGEKAYLEQLERSLAAHLSIGDAQKEAEKARANELENYGKKIKMLKEELSLSEQIAKKIQDFKDKEAIDPGGKLQKQAEDALAKGDTGKAERFANRIKDKESNADRQKKFGREGPIGKSVQDQAKDAGINTFGKTKKELEDELNNLPEKMKKDLNKEGEDKREKNKGGGGGKPPMQDPLVSAVNAIRELVAKIEPKLPQTALGA